MTLDAALRIIRRAAERWLEENPLHQDSAMVILALACIGPRKGLNVTFYDANSSDGD